MPDDTPDSGTPSDVLLADLQRHTFDYFLHEVNSEKGLVKDNTREESPASIAAVGLALACFPVAVERGYVTREEAVARVLATLRFFWESEQSEAPDATGYRGFYYHFLDMESGRRVWESELSTIDTTLLIAGALLAAQYFDGDGDEAEVRQLADALYRRVEWDWAFDGGPTVSHGWTPEDGFIPHRWEGYSEALLLYALALGSPTHPVPEASYAAWLETYDWRTLYETEHVYAGPLFIHQLSHAWIDFRGLQDAFMREKGIDYFENSRRATHVQREYAIRNPRGFRGYGENAWGVTASDGPGPAEHAVDGEDRQFWAYLARGVPFGPDDGTLSPWAVVASLPFAPEIVLPALAHVNEEHPEVTSKYGFKCSFNPTFPGDETAQGGWISQGYYGLDQGPIVLMIENHRTGLPWRLMRDCAPLVRGLRRAGFAGGWLDGAP
ncbi:glucoamylase family protein [Rubrivirga sp. S365]|uniref:glucoamylase family protein n=1 Tax=Rubrivirga sp. S365 TaxID=3076080 RepID=UPI0028C5C197|nr:glucoamylase family protein [Rubrivirga sp. S365]MDT7858367.1 glucoamylase family protein [Rubrivirga sp. S365]